MVGVFIDRTAEETERHRLTSYIRNEQKKSMMDDLTGIMNRKGFQRTVEKILQKDGVNAGVLMVCDLDNFKSVNDSLGHPEGDFVLKLFADVLKKEFRKSDVIGRIGGDEFMIFLPNAVGDLALRKKLDHFMDSVRGRLSAYRKYELSVSVGVSRIDADTGVMDFRKLYESADTALYVAKGLGKNQYYINDRGIRCMKNTCAMCRHECPRSEALALRNVQM